MKTHKTPKGPEFWCRFVFRTLFPNHQWPNFFAIVAIKTWTRTHQTLEAYREAPRGYIPPLRNNWAFRLDLASRTVPFSAVIYAVVVVPGNFPFIAQRKRCENAAKYTHGAPPCCLLVFGSGLARTGRVHFFAVTKIRPLKRSAQSIKQHQISGPFGRFVGFHVPLNYLAKFGGARWP